MNSASSNLRKMNVEILEERVLLAGSITFAGILVVPGIGPTAVLAGSGSDVGLTIENDGVGNYVFTAAPGTTLNIDGFVGTSFTTSAAQTAALNGGLNLGLDFGTNAASDVDLGGGNSLNLMTDLIIRGSNGNDTVDIFGNATISGSLVADQFGGLGTGNDTVNHFGAVTGNVGVDLGSGTNTVLVGVTGTAGSMNVTGGPGTDTVTVHGTVSGSVSTNLGNGTNTTTISTTGSAGSLNVTGGTQTDTTTINGSVSGNAAVNLGNGTNTLNVGTDLNGTTSVGGNLAYMGGTGTDTVVIPQEAATNAVNGNVVINAGDGTNTFTLGQDIGGTFSYVGGSGVDTLNLLDDGDIDGNAAITTGGGNDAVNALAGTFEFNADASISTGAGDDTVSILGTTNFDGNTTVDLGANLLNDTFDIADGVDFGGDLAIAHTGNATIQIGLGIFAAGVDINGNFSVNGGTGSNVTILRIDDTDIDGSTTISLGGGNDTLDIDDWDVNNGDNFINNTVFGTVASDSVQFLLGNGNDVLEIDNEVVFNGNSFHDGGADTVGDTRYLDFGVTFNGTNVFQNFELFAEVIFP